jgi:hypothetical protein
MSKLKRFKDVDPNAAKRVVDWFENRLGSILGKTKDECREALKKSNALCIYADGEWKVSISGYSEAIKMFE